MRHKITEKQFKQVRDEIYTVIKFKDGKRVITCGGCSIVRVVQELVEETLAPMEVLVVNETLMPEVRKEYSRDIKDFEQYFRAQRKLF